jgi:hypothetical protein
MNLSTMLWRHWEREGGNTGKAPSTVSFSLDEGGVHIKELLVLDKRLGWFQSWSGHSGKKNNSLPLPETEPE